ncbi:NAD-dependent epimerase/dehydratase family protein [Phreatobacter oligotrophus]|uniref:NAD-dependent epimerase/dehydratase family protein n=1 Tax=Phreatobacter oligotrophus TaxID=1122261 RepID=UPI002356AC8E|nr:NAD-dependent epimerase/dehydratase family protein [Phreatobacter oligotrophus]MBX9990059.1 NAD-dependent epimerase/dehydratase family protein [Phreatobacter oligotrophus]
MPHLLVFGLGYSSRATIRAAGTRYDHITATVRSADRAAALSAAPVEGHAVTVLPFDGSDVPEALAAAIASADDILVSAPPNLSGDPVLAACGSRLAAHPPKGIAYLSTVGVYGDHGGGWVDEQTPATPSSIRSRERVEAEAAWQAFGRAHGVPVAVLRLSGIYGPGQNALVNLARGTARRIIKPGQVFNRIHVDDIAQAVLASFDKRYDGIVNVTDDEPSPAQDVVAHAAEILGVPVPPDIPFEQSGLSEMGRSFYDECKRVRNDRLKGELSVKLLYPNYRVALRALAAGGDGRH